MNGMDIPLSIIFFLILFAILAQIPVGIWIAVILILIIRGSLK